MIFFTLKFLVFFLIIFAPLTFFKTRRKPYTLFLALVNAIYYYFLGLNFFLILIGNVIINYLIIRSVYIFNKDKKKIVFLGIAINILFLAFFKYGNFIINQLLILSVKLPIFKNIPILEILIPVGISFYTFKVISHLIDSYKGIIDKCPTFINYFCYVTFFPQVTSGPIGRANEFYEDIKAPHLNTYSQGFVITKIILGILKKYVIASFLFDFVTKVFATPINYSRCDLIVTAFAYSFLIYVDFSGYSDFAVAISKLLGIRCAENFNMPYQAKDINDFWNRWHISLSNWFKDYVYIPLGGNRKGKLRKYLNIFITMIISGIWHGAGLTFLVWGALQGIGSVFSYLFKDLSDFIKIKFKTLQKPSKIRRFIGSSIQWIFTFTFITIAWIFFNSKNFDISKDYIHSIIKPTIFDNKIINVKLLIVMAIPLILNFKETKIVYWSEKLINRKGLVGKVLIITIIIYLLIKLGPELVPPFIYFNF